MAILTEDVGEHRQHNLSTDQFYWKQKYNLKPYGVKEDTEVVKKRKYIKYVC
jgi:hypothetical protein